MLYTVIRSYKISEGQQQSYEHVQESDNFSKQSAWRARRGLSLVAAATVVIIPAFVSEEI